MKNMEPNDLIGEATAYDKEREAQAGKPKNCADAVKDIANDTLNVTKEFVKDSTSYAARP